MTAPAGVGTAVELEAWLSAERAAVEAVMADAADGMLRGWPDSLAEPARYALATRGKRLRPILCVAAYRAVRGDEVPAALRRLACAVEVVHTYSLVHDDLPCMDDDDLRRGRPTVHRVHGVAAAARVGAALIPAAVRLLDGAAAELGLDADERGRLVGELCRAGGARGMVGGQLLDLRAEARPVDAAGLEAIHRRKTGSLLAASLRLGALAARAGEDALAALTVYGESLGLAFQIVDDVLDETGTDEVLGKTAGRDRSLGKATYPALFGIDGARALARDRADEAVMALRRGGVRSPELEALADYVLERRG